MSSLVCHWSKLKYFNAARQRYMTLPFIIFYSMRMQLCPHSFTEIYCLPDFFAFSDTFHSIWTFWSVQSGYEWTLHHRNTLFIGHASHRHVYINGLLLNVKSAAQKIDSKEYCYIDCRNEISSVNSWNGCRCLVRSVVTLSQLQRRLSSI